MRDRLMRVKGLFTKPGMFTLTVDRKRFAGPREAWEHITEGRYIPRLLQLLGVRRWAWVLEFQTKTGDGWPHWHTLVDLATCPGGRIDLKRAWEFWRDRWHLGGLDLSAKKAKLANAEHAIFYITKYLMKQPEGGYPMWVLEAHGIRFVQGCRALPALVADEASEEETPASEEPVKTYKPRRSLLERSSGCGLSCRVFRRWVDRGTGEVRHAWLGDLPCAPMDLVAFAQVHHDLPAGFTLEVDPDTHQPLILCDRELSRQDVVALGKFLGERTRALELREEKRDWRVNMAYETNVFRQRQLDEEGRV